MAGRLSPERPDSRSLGWRRALPWCLALLVLLLHLFFVQRLQGLQQDWLDVAEMPSRWTVSYVRELQQSRPAVPAAAPAKAVATDRAERAQAGPPAAAAASRPEVMPEPEPELPREPEGEKPGADPAPEADQPAAADAAAVAPEPARPASSAEPAAEAGPEWPASTRLSYELTGNYRGAVTGEAQVEWIRQGARYQVHLDVGVGPSFAPLISRRMSSDGRLTPRGIEPQRYDEDTRVLFSARRRVTVLFQGEQLTLANGRVEAAAPGTQDAASQFVQLTWLFLTGRQTLREGLVVELPLALPRRQYRWRYEVLGQEQLATPMGPLDTWHLRPSALASGGDLTAEVWLAPTLQYLPVRLRIRQDEQTYIDLMLRAPPAQAADAAPAPAPATAPAPAPAPAALPAPIVAPKIPNASEGVTPP